jgi:hypothetical protein
MNFSHADFMVNETRVTLQHLTIVNGKTTPKQVIPTAPAPCSQGYNDGEGGAIYMRDGNLTVIDCVFSGNQAAQIGPDTGGGAIYITGSKHGALIVGSVFTGNSASNAGAVGALFAELDIYDSLFSNNKATGNGANSDDATKCPNNINNGQHEVGSGGNGGAIYQDGGSSTNVVLCGVDVETNAAGLWWRCVHDEQRLHWLHHRHGLDRHRQHGRLMDTNPSGPGPRNGVRRECKKLRDREFNASGREVGGCRIVA